MKQEVFKQEFNKMFKWFTNEYPTSELPLELEFYKKLLNFFVIGPSYYFVMNHHNISIDFVSKEVEDVIGYTPSEYSIELMNDILHPDDRSWFLSFGQKTADFFSALPLSKWQKYKLRYDIRYKKKNGDYAWMVYQGLILEHDENGHLLRSLAMHTDITYLKEKNKPVLSFIGMDGEPSFIDAGGKNIFTESKNDFTQREKQVLTLLIEGKKSKEISSILNISKQTVDRHRKNMLHKKNLNTTGELVGKAISYAWI